MMSLTRPVFVEDAGPRRLAVDGTPADCIYLALCGLMDERPDVVVSGINAGANLGKDVFFSGTVAGARQAAFLGVSGIAASLVSGDDYREAARSVCGLANCLADKQRRDPLLLNLNYPSGSFEGPRFAPLGKRSYPRVVTKRKAPLTGQLYCWLGGPPIEDAEIPGTDGGLIAQGCAAATVLSLDQTDWGQIEHAAKLVDGIDPWEEKR